MSWPEVGYAFLLAVRAVPLDFLLVMFAVTFPVLMLMAPWLATIDDMNMFGWHVDPGAEAWLAVLGRRLSLVVSAYVMTLAAVAQAALARLLLDPREAQLARRGGRPAPVAAWTSSTRSRPSGAGSSATCTTASSSGWSP